MTVQSMQNMEILSRLARDREAQLVRVGGRVADVAAALRAAGDPLTPRRTIRVTWRRR